MSIKAKDVEILLIRRPPSGITQAQQRCSGAHFRTRCQVKVSLRGHKYKVQGSNRRERGILILHCRFSEIPLHAFNPVFLIKMGIAGGGGVV